MQHPIKIKRLMLSLSILFTFLHISQAQAMGLMEAYQAALANDSVYRAAIHDNEAGQQYKVIGRSNLLPNISANYAYNRNNQDITTSGNGFSRDETRNYNSENGAIQLRQPIINLEGWAKYRQGNLQTSISDQQFAARKQELIQRFFGLYAQANFAEDVLALSIAQRDAFKLQEQANQKMAIRGEGTKTALIESQAKLSLSEAQIIESQDNVTDARNALAQMIGQDTFALDTLTDEFKIQPLEPSDLETWKKMALEQNPEIAVQRESVELAYQDIRRNRAGHAPKLDAVASISKSKSDSVATFNQDIDSKSIGVQLNIPIYAGGSVDALTSQAESNYRKAQDELASKTNEVLLDLRKQFNTVQSSTLKIAALQHQSPQQSCLLQRRRKVSSVVYAQTWMYWMHVSSYLRQNVTYRKLVIIT